MTNNILYFGQDEKEWKEKAKNHERFCFTEDFLIDDEGNLTELADGLGVSIQDIKENPGFIVKPKSVKIKKGFPLTLISYNPRNAFTEVEMAGLRFELVLLPTIGDYIEVEMVA